MLGALAAPESSDFQAPLDVLNGTDVAIVQHEYGLYGGLDGDEILNTIIGIEVPVIVVAHTVLSVADDQRQRWILEELCKRQTPSW